MPKLIIIPTPIGNLSDVSYRIIENLKQVQLLLAEDTRQTKKLLNHYQIEVKLQAYHQHNEHRLTPSLIERMQTEDLEVGLVSDAGMPGISDPAFLLIKAAVEAGIAVECLPGPTALVPALVVSGFPCDRFCFEGFLPHKKGRQKRLKSLAEEERSMVFYESPNRILKFLKEIAIHLGEDRPVAVCKELTKIHEQVYRGRVIELIEFFEKEKTIKGEFAIVIHGKKQ